MVSSTHLTKSCSFVQASGIQDERCSSSAVASDEVEVKGDQIYGAPN